MKVAFLGLGTMGAPMAANVLLRGHSLAVWNRTAARAEPLTKKGARLAATPADAASDAEVILTMLADPAAVERAIGASDGVLSGLSPGAVVIDLSTVDPKTARSVDERVRARGGHYLDAPVSGTRKPAIDGTLLILAGGPPEVIERVRPVLEAMGRIKHVGVVGQGMAMKLVLNGLGAHMITGFAAVLALGAQQGLGTRDMLEVIGSGAFSSPLYVSKGERIVQRDFRADFTVALMRKDQALVLATARELGYRLPTLEAVQGVLDEAIAAGLGADDLCGVVQLFEKWAGVTVGEK